MRNASGHADDKRSYASYSELIAILFDLPKTIQHRVGFRANYGARCQKGTPRQQFGFKEWQPLFLSPLPKRLRLRQSGALENLDHGAVVECTVLTNIEHGAMKAKNIDQTDDW